LAQKENIVAKVTGNIEAVIGSSLSVPTNIALGLADLLIGKGIISRAEMASLIRHLLDNAERHEDSEHVTMVLEKLLERYQERKAPR
jgi:hypothetical protein